jgi:hypothetical protein
MTWHVEGHAAAIMRQKKIKDAVLYINAPPCKWERGCAATLEDVLPASYTLTVYYRKSPGTFKRLEFEGNGQGLEDGG